MCFVYLQSPLHENLSFLFVRTRAMSHIIYLSCGIPFPVKTPSIIFGLTSVVVWLSREKSSRKISGIFLKGEGRENILRGGPISKFVLIF